jgi:DNA polymerase I
VAARNPSTIIPMGNTAAQTVLETGTGITALRVGPPKSSDQFPGVRIVPTFHPAACLRAADFFPHLVTDFGKALAPTPTVTFTEPVVTVIDDPIDGYKVVNELQEKYTELVVDIEVGIDKETHFGHPEQYTMLCIGIGYKPGFVVVFGENCCADGMFKKEFRRLLQTKLWIAHNGKFDLAGLYGYTSGTMGRLHFDTMLASYVLDERPGTHGLKYLAAELLGAPDYAADISRYVGKNDSYAVVPRDVLYRYNALDVACTLLLYERYKTELDGDGRRLHDFLCEASIPLALTEMEGVAIDNKYSEQLVHEYLDRLEPLEVELKPWVENPRSPKQVKEALHDMGFRVGSTDEDHLKAILEKAAPDSDTNTFIRLMLQHRREAKLYGTYVKGTRKRLYRGRVHSSFLLHGTTTGRLASRNPNLQNVPRESTIRRQYVPDQGNVFVQADYATIELRVMAVEASDSFLGDIFRTGEDIHDKFSLTFYGPGFTKEQRVRTKAFVYGLSYGREANSIAIEYGMSVQEAKRISQVMFDMMPGVKTWRDWVIQQVFKESEDLVTRFGRHRRFWLITKENAKDVRNQALAFIPQSTASDVNLAAFIKLRRDHGLRTRIPVHDSILVECPISDTDRVADLMVRVMEETAIEHLGDSVPFPVEVKFGESWGHV